MCEVHRSENNADLEPFKQLALNEVFVAEDDPSHQSNYLLRSNQKYLGKFNSSGVLISTGSGSSGWLYGAKRMTNKKVKAILSEVGKESNNTNLDIGAMEEELANQESSATHFAPSKEAMYFYVREPASDSQFAEGFAKEVGI